MHITSTITLNNGVAIPRLGFGVFKSKPGTETENAVAYALITGCRHIDTAQIYRNEKDVGEALRKSEVPRDDFFITTKIWNNNQGYDKTMRTFDESLDVMGLSYIDLLLIHWPLEKLRKETWKALEKLYNEKRCRAIGVSNYTVNHLKEMEDYAEITPAVNQVEFHPFLYQKELLNYCIKKNITLAAYSPLTRGEKLDNETLVSIAGRYNKTPAQILIRWCLQHDLVVLPKSVHRERILENANVFDFEIADADMQILDSLNENFRVAWDPTDVP